MPVSVRVVAVAASSRLQIVLEPAVGRAIRVTHNCRRRDGTVTL